MLEGDLVTGGGQRPKCRKRSGASVVRMLLSEWSGVLRAMVQAGSTQGSEIGFNFNQKRKK